MPNYLSTQASKFYESVGTADGGSLPRVRIENQLPGHETGGLMVSIAMDWTTTGSESSLETVYGPILKAGWAIVPELSFLSVTTSAGTTFEVDIGYRPIDPDNSIYSPSDNAFADGIDLTSAGNNRFIDTVGALYSLGPFKFTEDIIITANYASVASPNSSVKINGTIICAA